MTAHSKKQLASKSMAEERQQNDYSHNNNVNNSNDNNGSSNSNNSDNLINNNNTSSPGNHNNSNNHVHTSVINNSNSNIDHYYSTSYSSSRHQNRNNVNNNNCHGNSQNDSNQFIVHTTSYGSQSDNRNDDINSTNFDNAVENENGQMVTYTEYMNSLEHLRCRIDVVDMTSQTDNQHKYILIYQDDATKFVFLKPLQTKDVMTISSSIIDIFCQLGSTLIISAECSDFALLVATEVRKQWPGCFVVSGRSPSETEIISFQKCRDMMRQTLMDWMEEKQTHRWSVGIRFVQWRINTTDATQNVDQTNTLQVRLMNERALLGVSSLLNTNIVVTIVTETDLINALIANDS